MKKLFFNFLFIPFILLNATAQSQDTIDTVKTHFADFNYFAGNAPEIQLQNDTIFENIFFYDRLKQQHLYLPRTGNPGSASYNVFNSNQSGKIFTDGFDQFSPYILNPLKKFPSLHPERRYSNVNYHLASKKEQHIFISHEQKIRPWLMAGLDFGALSSVGDIARQKNTNRCFDTWFAYETPANTYRVYVSFTSNKVENQENGGISDDSEFEDASSLDTKTLSINLSNAITTHKLRDYIVKQDLNLSNLFGKRDTSESVRDFKDGSLVLSHSLWWSRKSIIFDSQNADSGYFNNFYLDTALTYDSSFYNNLYNQAMLEYTSPLNSNGHSFSIGGGLNYEMVDYFTLVIDTSYQALMAVLSGGFKSKKITAGILYSQSVSGDFTESYMAQINLDYLINQKGDRVFLNFTASNSPQSLRDRLYVSNHFAWRNEFEPENRFEASGGIELSKYKLGLIARTVTVKNMVFFREDFLPQAYNDYVSFGEVAISKIFRFGKFGMDDKITLAYSGNENVVRLPSTVFYASFYYTNLLFKKALGFRAGIDVTMQSSYNTYGYMPATGAFYLQDDKSIGNYPMAGIFVGMKIKTASIFLRLDHLNAGLGERTYYGAYHYPLPGRTIKFGVSWDLLD